MATAKRARVTSTETKKKTAGSANGEAVTPQEQQRATASQPQGLSNVEEVIRQRAYQLWEEQGRVHGKDVENWLRAESEIYSHQGARSA